MALFVNCEHLLFEKKIPDLKKKFQVDFKNFTKSYSFWRQSCSSEHTYIDLSLGRKITKQMLGSVRICTSWQGKIRINPKVASSHTIMFEQFPITSD